MEIKINKTNNETLQLFDIVKFDNGVIGQIISSWYLPAVFHFGAFAVLLLKYSKGDEWGHISSEVYLDYLTEGNYTIIKKGKELVYS